VTQLRDASRQIGFEQRWFRAPFRRCVTHRVAQFSPPWIGRRKREIPRKLRGMGENCCRGLADDSTPL